MTWDKITVTLTEINERWTLDDVIDANLLRQSFDDASTKAAKK